MFTVVIPLYNKELSIFNTIQSVLDQTFEEFEILVINDGSTDNSTEIVKKIDDTRVRLINQHNQGVSAARNKGIKESKYPWIALLDGDDIWKPNHLEEIKNMMCKFPGFYIYVTSFCYSNKKNSVRHISSSDVFEIKNYFLEAMRKNIIWTSVVVINKASFDKIGGFKEELTHGEDLDLWGRLAKEYKIIKSEKITAIYRIDAENRSTSSFEIKKSRLYNYNFEHSSSDDETKYYRAQLNSSIRGFILQRKLKECLQLIVKHHKHISFFDLLKIKLL